MLEKTLKQVMILIIHFVSYEMIGHANKYSAKKHLTLEGQKTSKHYQNIYIYLTFIITY